MSTENVDIVRRLLESFIAGDLKWDLMSEDVEIRDLDIPDSAGTYRGHDGFNKWMADWDSAFGTTDLSIEQIDDHGDQIVAVINVTAVGSSSGIETKRRNAIVYEVAAGQVTKSDFYTTEEEANAAIKTASKKS